MAGNAYILIFKICFVYQTFYNQNNIKYHTGVSIFVYKVSKNQKVSRNLPQTQILHKEWELVILDVTHICSSVWLSDIVLLRVWDETQL